MKKTLSIILINICAISAFSQVTAPLPLREGMGEGLSGTGFTLEQLIDSAMQNNIAMRSARHDIAAAGEQRREAFTKYFPNVSGTGAWFNANRGLLATDVRPSELLPSALGESLSQTLPAEALAALGSPLGISLLKNGTLGGINAVQPVFAGGQIVNSNKLARVGEEVEQLKMELSANEVEKTVTGYYWQLVSLQAKEATLDAVDRLLADIHKDVEVSVQAGLVLRNDLLQVELRQNAAQSQRLKLQNGISIVKLLLGQYASLTPNPSPKGEGSIYSFNVELPDSTKQNYLLPSPLREGSGVGLLPEYKLLEKQVEAATLQRKIAVGQQLPTIAVGAAYSYSNLTDRSQLRGMVFATVSVPISDWWGGSHAIRRKRIAEQQAREQLANEAELLAIRRQKTWNDVEEARLQLDIAQRSIEQAEENLRIHRNTYRAGTTTMSDLLEAQLLYQQTRDRQTEALADYHCRLLDYRQATEGR